MSYCRFWWDQSQVYVYADFSGHITCCSCALSEGDFRAAGPEAMIQHLMEHRAAGHHVPDYALERLREEAGLPLEFPDRDFEREHAEWLIQQQDSVPMQEYGRSLLQEMDQGTDE